VGSELQRFRSSEFKVQGWEVQGFRGSKVKTYNPERGTLNPESITENV